MKTVNKIIESMSVEQKKSCRGDLGDALDIISDIAGDMPYSSLFTLTCAVMEELEATRFAK